MDNFAEWRIETLSTVAAAANESTWYHTTNACIGGEATNVQEQQAANEWRIIPTFSDSECFIQTPGGCLLDEYVLKQTPLPQFSSEKCTAS